MTLGLRYEFVAGDCAHNFQDLSISNTSVRSSDLFLYQLPAGVGEIGLGQRLRITDFRCDMEQ